MEASVVSNVFHGDHGAHDYIERVVYPLNVITVCNFNTAEGLEVLQGLGKGTYYSVLGGVHSYIVTWVTSFCIWTINDYRIGHSVGNQPWGRATEDMSFSDCT